MTPQPTPAQLGRWLPRGRIKLVLFGIAAVVAAVVYVSAKNRETPSLPVTTDATADRAPPPASLTNGTPTYTKLLQTKPEAPQDLSGWQQQMSALQQQLEEERQARLQLERDLQAKPGPVQATGPTPEDPERARRRQEAREAAKARAAEELAARKSGGIVNKPETAKPLAGTVLPPLSPYQLGAGSLISCTLKAAVNSERQTVVTATVSSPVYDTITGEHLVIPQGSKLIGSPRGVLFGEGTIDVSWEHLEYPDGSRVLLGGQPGGDRTGAGGLAGEIDHKWPKLVAAIAVKSGLNASMAAASTVSGTGVENRAGSVAAQSALQDSSQQVSQSMNVNPTIRVKPGATCSLMLKEALDLTPVVRAL
jgi:type IV secretory pathway VirB10-like protein